MRVQLLVLAALVYTVASQSCDENNGWFELSGYCYRVSRSAPEIQYTWHEAREACLAEGGDLASIHSEAEQDFIIQLAANVGLVGPHLWMGMNQLEQRSGAFSWVDGSDTAWTNWALSQPTTGGLTMCAYSATEAGPGPFQFYPYYSALYGIFNPDYDWPTAADGINTFYFGQNYGWTYVDCQNLCQANPNCAAATFWDYHYNYYWDHVCMGRSDFFNTLGPDSYADSGIRTLDAGETKGEWYAGNCGLNNGVACKKVIGSDAPITVPPTPVVDSFCPDGYISADKDRGNKCFRVVQIPSETQGFRWEQALLLCRSGPGVNPDLATIQSIEENAIITSHIQSYGWGFWIGLHYAGVHDSWVWADNNEGTYYNWAPGRPAGTDPCVEMWSMSGPAGHWGNQLCDQRRGYICQTFKDAENIVPTPPFTTPHECPSGWTPYWYGCYQYQSDARTWNDAKTHCESQDSTLVTIHAEAENSAVFFGADGNFPLWIGLTKNQTSGGYQWVDGWGNYYLNFDEGGQDNGEGCVMMKSNAMWNDTVCSATYPSVCKKTDHTAPTVDPPGDGYCPVDWVKWGFKCYYFSPNSDDWSGAATDCRLRGASINGDLMSIENEPENLFVYQTMKTRSSVVSAWMGLYRNPTSPNYTWADGSNSDFRKWGPGEPSNPLNELCGEMDINFGGVASFWYDYACTGYNHYVCKGDQGPKPTYPPVPSVGPGECPSSEWLALGSDCVLVRPAQYLSWHGALETCKYLTGGIGSLATIRSYEENQQIWYLTQALTPPGLYPEPSIWIGLYKEGLGFPYKWEDDDESTFRWWAPGEPNDVDGTANCVRMYIFVSPTEGMWDDYYGHQNYDHGYVCRTPQGSYAHLDIDEANFVPEAEKMRRNMTKQAAIDPDMMVEDWPEPGSDESNVVVGSVLGLVALCVLTAAIVLLVYRKKQQRMTPQQEMSFENPLSEDVAADVEQPTSTDL